MIGRGFLAIVTGRADVGAYLTDHPGIDTLHITGSIQSHDAIVFGTGAEGADRKSRNAPRNPRPITSELGAVCPTIVVPGPWTKADLRFQAENVATQKLHNSGFNCVACQVLIVPKDWSLKADFLAALREALKAAPARPLYYPGAADRLGEFRTQHPAAERLDQEADARLVATLDPARADEPAFHGEIFAPALGIVEIDGKDAASFFGKAVAFANSRLHGTLGANVIVDPITERRLGDAFETQIAALRYGTVGVNVWTGVGFLLAHAPWGAYPGHPLNDVQSGRGFVHNCLMLDRAQRAVIRAPFRPAPRGLLHGSLALLPNPPWFVGNRTGATTARRLVEYLLKPSLTRLAGVLASALRG